MKKVALFSIFSMVILTAALSNVYAQTLKVGVFDIHKIMRESKKIQGYRATLEKEINAKRALLKQKQEAAVGIEERLKKEGDKISANEVKRLQEKLAGEVKELKRLREDIDAELQKVDRDLAQRAFREISEVIKSVAEREAYSIVFERSQAGIAYVQDPFDVTQKIINAYDAGK